MLRSLFWYFLVWEKFISSISGQFWWLFPIFWSFFFFSFCYNSQFFLTHFSTGKYFFFVIITLKILNTYDLFIFRFLCLIQFQWWRFAGKTTVLETVWLDRWRIYWSTIDGASCHPIIKAVLVSNRRQVVLTFALRTLTFAFSLFLTIIFSLSFQYSVFSIIVFSFLNKFIFVIHDNI